jgi:hypothetical protein
MPLGTIDHGWWSAAGLSAEGWYVAAVVYDGCDRDFLEPTRPEKFHLRPDKTSDQWSQALDNLKPRRLMLLQEGAEELLAEADRILGPAAPKASTEQPCLAWCERREQSWRLQILHNGAVQTLHESDRPLSRPSVAYIGATVYVACKEGSPHTGRTLVLNDAGETMHVGEGANPLLFGADEGLWLLAEKCSADHVRPVLRELLSGGDAIALPSPEGYLLQPDLLYEDSKRTLYLTCEACPRWGHDELIGRQKQLGLWMLPAGATEFLPGPGTANGILPVPVEAYASSPGRRPRQTQQPPITPRLFLQNDRLWLAYRRFRPRGFKEFGWDVHAIRWDDPTWSEPVRFTEELTPPDTPFALLVDRESPILVCTEIQQDPGRSFEQIRLGERGYGGVPQPILHQAVVAHRLQPDSAALPIAAPPERRGAVRVPPSWENIAPEPAAMEAVRRTLLWSDFHNHSCYSKCMAAMDGTPEENLRFQRDVLGCKILTLTDHWHLMSQREYLYTLDLLEAEAGDDCIVIYGCEPGSLPGHHTNFYTIRRDLAERLWAIVYTVQSRSEIYRRIKTELPAGEVLALRHFHGGPRSHMVLDAPQIRQTHEPALELAFEAMQNRGCSMLNRTPKDQGLDAFPVNFLNAGCKLGVLGGSDHNGGEGINHYCLTGFWVNEPTAEGVWEALRTRKTIATENGKVALWTELQSQPMGETMHGYDWQTVHIRCHSPRRIRRVWLMVNGEEKDSVEVNADQADVTLSAPVRGNGIHWISAVVEADSAYQDAPVTAFSSPFFIESPY